MSRKTKDRIAKAARVAGPDYPKSTVDGRELAAFKASKYIPTGKHRTVPAGNR